MKHEWFQYMRQRETGGDAKAAAERRDARATAKTRQTPARRNRPIVVGRRPFRRGGGGEPCLQPLRRRLTHRWRPQHGPHGGQVVEGGAASRAPGHMRLDLCGVHRIQLAVQQRLKQHRLVRTGGHWAAPARAFQVCASNARARDSRDITVPIGAPVISAIWR